jgi:fatty-acyl-CoA synthase
VTAAGATHVCLDRPDPELVWDAIHRRGVTHLSAAPTVLRGLADHPGAEPVPGAPLKVGTGGAPPSPALLARLSELNVEVTHLYGLTETYGPAVVCDWQPEWDAQPHAEQARLKSRQGNANILAGELRVADEAGAEVPADGETLGEVVLRGNNVMLGYYRDPAATEEATLGDGWLRTGDLAVLHPDGYVELRDRAKDIVISGGENVPSIEVEHAVGGHPAVAEVAVVGRPDERWGEVPVAFVTLHAGAQATADELVAYARQTLPGFKAPREIVFDALPKTATGKIQKNLLRERVRAQQRA